MHTPLNNPITLNLTLTTQEDVIALALRANLDPGNLRQWYHDVRNRPNVIVPDVRMKEMFKVLRAAMADEGFDFIDDSLAAPAARAVAMG